MAEIDGSIPASAGKVPNQLQSLGEMATAMGAMNANRLFMAKQAAGQALQASIGPDGQPDLAKFNALIAQNPRIAPFAQEALTQSLAQQGAGIANTGAGLSLQAAQGDRVRAMIGTLGPNASHDSVLGALSLLAQTGQIKPDFAANVAGNLPGDPAQIGAWARNNFQLPALGPQGALEATVGPVATIDSGPKINLIRTPSLGEPKAIGSVDKSLTPAESVTPAYDKYNPATQQMEHVTAGAALAAQQGPKGAAAGIVPAAPPLGEGEAAAAAGTGSGQLLVADRADQAASASRISILRHVNDLLATPEGKTGPGVQVVNGWRNFLLANAPWLASATNGGIDEAKIKSATQDELKKYMVQVAGSAASQYGQGTNEKLAVAASGNANPDLSTLANRDVTRMNIALERAKQARMAAWDASGQPEKGYGAFTSTWNRTHDPRAFMLDLLSPGERAKMLSAITSDADKRALLVGKRAAEQAGLYAEKDIPR